MLGEASFRQADFARARLALGQACRIALEAGLYSRVLLAIYYAAHLLGAEAERASENVLESAFEGNIEQRAQAIMWLELYLRHPAAWSVFKEKGARQLAYLRAQAPEAARLASEALPDDAPLDALLKSATSAISAWAGPPATMR
jgi:hypothetical protein